MLRFLSCLLLTVGLFVGVAQTATACINDRESPTHEKEFKSNYLEQPAPSAPVGPPASKQYKMPIVSALGIAALFLGAVAGTLVVVRRR